MATFTDVATATAIDPKHHAVQFYDDDAFLVDAVTEHLARGLRARQPLLVAATVEHGRAFAERLASKGLPLGAAIEDGSLVLLDARRTLDELMVDGMPDPARFARIIGCAVTRQLRTFGHGPVVAYGEIVDLLCRSRQTAAAARLEDLWDGLVETGDVSLLCAYSMAHFDGSEHDEAFAKVCRQHTHVVPADDYPVAGSEQDRLREVARLQRRARVLEIELMRRQDLESALREAVRSRDDFVSIVAHELRNPVHTLNLQVLSAYHAARADGAQTVSQRLGRAADQVTRLARLLDNLLDVSRITTGRIDLEPEDVDVSDVVRTVVERNREAWSGTPVALSLDRAVGRWDPLRLDQIVSNLMSNAIKYGGGKPVDVSVTRDPHAVRLRVRDRGVGIDPGDCERVFARFERAVVARRVGGFGLGLWITRQLVERMSGSIGVESTLGEGSVFSVTLPCAEPCLA